MTNSDGRESLQYKNDTASDAVALFQALADNAPVLIWMAGTNKRCNFFNKRWLDFRGRSLDAELKYGWLGGVHDSDRQHCAKEYEMAFDLRQEFSLKCRVERVNGEFHWIMMNAAPVYLDNGGFAGYMGTCLDVTDSESDILNLKQQNYLMTSITDHASVGLFMMDSRNCCTFMNPAAEKLTGYAFEEVRGKRTHDVFHHHRPDGSVFPREECEIDRTLREMTKLHDAEQTYIKKNGEFYPVLCTASPIVHDGKLIGSVLEVRDITDQKKSEGLIKRNEVRFKALIENSSDVISLIDGQGNSLYTSPSVQRVLGYDPYNPKTLQGLDLVHPADLPFVIQELSTLREKPGERTTAEVRVKHADGSWRWIETVSTNLLEDRHVGAIVVNYRDVTERKVAEERARHQYYHDTLTNLPNRNYFSERLGELVKRQNSPIFGILIIDLDRFKIINESLGHGIGDRMIQDVSVRLASCLEEADVLARLGGDEYGIILPNILSEEEVGQVCSKILEVLKPAFRIEKQELYITPSIGITVFPHDGEDVSTLLKNGDSALYRAKEMGRNNFQYYNSTMNATTFQQLAMENTLRKALENNEFLVYYQPQIDIQSGKIIQVEALIRWMHPELGLTFPDEFIPIAETTGLIQPIGEWVLKEACMEVKRWEKLGHKVNLAVNMSVRQLRQRNLIKVFRNIIAESQFDPTRLELEITESVLMDNTMSAYNTMVQLKKDGVMFAIDDFNTGYSSLNYIKRFPIDILKIDKTFMKGVPGKEKDAAIANAIINLAHSLNMLVVAEGVEREDQLRFLKERHCDKAQGYLFSAPVSAIDLLEILKKIAPSDEPGAGILFLF